jgi:cell division initiation protein
MDGGDAMKFSPEDIANQSFQKSFRGLDPEQVREFLVGVAREWEQLAAEVKRLQNEVEGQQKELRDYRRRERSLVEALEMAKQVAGEIRHQAERDAELVIARTEIKAEKILAQAEGRVAELRAELFELQRQRIRFQTQMQHMLESHRQLLDDLDGEWPGDELAGAVSLPRPAIHRAPRHEVCDEDIESAQAAEITDEIRRRANTLTGFREEAGA